MNEKQLTAVFDADTKRTHRFLIDDSDGIRGSIYVPKDKAVPNTIVIHLRTKAQKEQEQNVQEK